MFEIIGKVAVVTGGASGIGLSISKALLENGVKAVTIVDNDEKNGKVVLQNIKDEYGDERAIFIKTDVADKKQLENALQSTVDTFNHVDILVNNAGVGLDSDWEKAIAINLTATVTGTILAIENYLSKFKTGNEGIVLNVSSILGLDSCSCSPVYSATKRGIIGLTKSFGSTLHYERCKIRVMAICPGFTNTSLLQTGTSTFLNNDYCEMSAKEFGKIFLQDVASVSKAAIEMIRNGENGCVWVVEDNQPPYEIEFLPRQKLKKNE
ncbi:hypothetical protein RN001_009151 [Aquatica leii]|uniref:15-hydroxyprostaglandin dehydrogenase [NAD(+)]-like n=1 Tax=Aquatica leii TaxID=1421715 RepID=A0AAN7SPS6_9COLE|nr:hypothetical protein RN001_009151 [Aquatica leii]